MLIAILIGLAVLAMLIFVHELGHFITAKAIRVKVEEFGIGFPPRLLSKKLGETRYSLNAIPLGGFTKMSGEVDPEEPGSLASKGIGARLLVLSAGSLMNILLALLLLSVVFMIPHDVLIGEVVIKEVAPNSPAARAGLEAGDTIISINDKPIKSTMNLSRYLQLNLGNEITMVVRHDDSATETVRIIPRWKPPEGQGATGIVVTMSDPTIVSQHYPFWEAVPLGVTQFVETFVLYKNGLISMIIGTAGGTVVGPVGIVQYTGEVAMAGGLSPLIEFTAVISLILGIVNLFPLPALDGGRIVFVLLEWVRRGKRVSPKKEGLVHAIGFALLMAVILIITYQDIIRIISGESLIP